MKNKFNNDDVEIIEKTDEYDYGSVKEKVCTYTNGRADTLGTVGEMAIKQIMVWYIYEENKYDYAMYAAEYLSDDYDKYQSVSEMLKYKYGNPYSSNYAKSGSSSSYASLERSRLTWKNQNDNQELRITSNNFVYNLGRLATYEESSVEIYYCNVEMSEYVSNQRELYEAKQKEEEMSKKDYDGL